ncbi:MAG TPA: hypothetical protein VN903_04800 [Polyangia bacterium]|jgi:hypothetical protein|nr:hypothetical protein [Polyangia bacterium]
MKAMALVVLATTLTWSVPRRAEAALDPATALSALQKAYSLYSAVKSLFGQTEAQLIQQAVNQLLAYLNTQRDLNWKTQAQSAVNDLYSLSTHTPGDPTNDALFQNIWTALGTSGLDDIHNVLTNSNDPASSYQAAPVSAEMAAAWIGLLLMKQQIYPGFPATWGDYQPRVRENQELDYFLTGARYFLCWPGYDPGKGGYTYWNAPPNHYWSDPRAVYASQLWKYMANHYERISATYAGGIVVRATYANPVTANTYTYIAGIGSIPITDPATMLANKATAINQYTVTYDADPVIQIIRKSMNSVAFVGGGNDPADGTSTSLPAQAMYVDPWVNDTTGDCGADFWYSVYVASNGGA